jgi:hypothetical protein
MLLRGIVVVMACFGAVTAKEDNTQTPSNSSSRLFVSYYQLQVRTWSTQIHVHLNVIGRLTRK